MLVPGRSAQRLRSVRWLSVKHSDALPASFVSGKERTHQHMTFSRGERKGGCFWSLCLCGFVLTSVLLTTGLPSAEGECFLFSEVYIHFNRQT
ncbi:hypothetical protein XENOCAPTIV_016169 [Xenoophorus captivus]|uniref:Uncharacterized protein n=1 Tax=Xenoophorus captivus TaxID=1517983 RepID=A0ABV0R976_9TELE